MLHLLQADTKRKYRYAWKDESFLGFEQQVCSFCGRMISECRYDGDIHRLILEGGNTYPDYLTFTGAGERLFLLSERAVRIFEDCGIAGFSGKREVMVSDGPQYFAMEISGRVELDFVTMQLKKKKLCPECGQFGWNRQRMDPVILDEGSWDGCDICRVKSLPGFFACSERFAEAVKDYKLTGFVL